MGFDFIKSKPEPHTSGGYVYHLNPKSMLGFKVKVTISQCQDKVINNLLVRQRKPSSFEEEKNPCSLQRHFEALHSIFVQVLTYNIGFCILSFDTVVIDKKLKLIVLSLCQFIFITGLSGKRKENR